MAEEQLVGGEVSGVEHGVVVLRAAQVLEALRVVRLVELRAKGLEGEGVVGLFH